MVNERRYTPDPSFYGGTKTRLDLYKRIITPPNTQKAGVWHWIRALLTGS